MKVVLKSITRAKSHVLPSTFEHSCLGAFPNLKLHWKELFLWGIKVWVGFWLGEGGGGRICQKKQTRRITITFPSCPCPRVQLVIEADREGATEPTKTRLWPPEETSSWFWHWHLKVPGDGLSVVTFLWKASKTTLTPPARLHTHSSRCYGTSESSGCSWGTDWNYSFSQKIPELGNLRIVQDQNYSDSLNSPVYFSPLSSLLLAFCWAKLIATVQRQQCHLQIPVIQFHTWATESTFVGSRDIPCFQPKLALP